MYDKLLKGGDVAILLGISRSLAYRMMRTGEIQSIRFGRTIRVRPEALERFLQDRTVNDHLLALRPLYDRERFFCILSLRERMGAPQDGWESPDKWPNQGFRRS